MPDGAVYNEDFYLWALEQAERLRRLGASGSNLDLDYENLAEEIESLSRQDRQKIESYLETVFEHLVKLRFSTSTPPRGGWMGTVRRARRDIARRLKGNKTLEAQLPEMALEALTVGCKDASFALEEHGEGSNAAVCRMADNTDLLAHFQEEEFFPNVSALVSPA